MGKTATNIAIVLGLITVAFAGYYLYTQRDATTLSFSPNQQSVDNMLQNTRVFIDRRRTLNEVELNVEFFEDERFRSLENFRQPIEDRPTGRLNPFAPVAEDAGQADAPATTN